MNEVENTARILREEIPLIKRMLCYIGLHKWTQYGPAQAAKKEDKWGSRKTIHYQMRECASCKYYDARTIKIRGFKSGDQIIL